MRLDIYNEIIIDWKIEDGEILGLTEDDNVWVSLADESDTSMLEFLQNARDGEGKR